MSVSKSFIVTVEKNMPFTGLYYILPSISVDWWKSTGESAAKNIDINFSWLVFSVAVEFTFGGVA